MFTLLKIVTLKMCKVIGRLLLFNCAYIMYCYHVNVTMCDTLIFVSLPFSLQLTECCDEATQRAS